MHHVRTHGTLLRPLLDYRDTALTASTINCNKAIVTRGEQQDRPWMRPIAWRKQGAHGVRTRRIQT